MSELQGQMEMDVLGGTAGHAEPMEGYDAEGRLINPGNSPSQPVADSPLGEGALAQRAADMEGASPRATSPSNLERSGNMPGVAATPRSGGEADIETVLAVAAARINAIKDTVRRTTLQAAVEIGRELLAVRGAVPQGRWLRWLSENVDYSERTAQNLIALCETYGKGGNPQALADLSYTQAVALLGLPAEQREALIESGAAAEMSTRELEGEVKRLREENARQQLTLAELEAEARRAGEEASGQRAKVKDLNQTVRELKKNSADAVTRMDAAREQAADAVKRAGETDEKLRAARARIEELEAREPEVQVVTEIPKDVAEELERLREMRRRAPSEAVVRLRAGYERLLSDFEAVKAGLVKVKAEDEKTAEAYRAALEKAFTGMAAQIGEAMA